MITIENTKVTISTQKCVAIYPLSSICFVRIKEQFYVIHAMNGESVSYPISNQEDRSKATLLANLVGNRDVTKLNDIKSIIERLTF